MADIYRSLARIEPGPTRERMLGLVNAVALTVSARNRLEKAAIRYNGARRQTEKGDTEIQNQAVGGARRKINVASSDHHGLKQKICDMNSFMDKIEEDIQKYISRPQPVKLRSFSDKIFENIQRMRRDRYKYKDENGKDEVDVPKIRKLMKTTAAEFTSIMKMISSYCIELLGPPPCRYAHVGMGSLAREDFTPYSDFENLVVLEEGDHSDDIYNYFRWYSVLFQIIIIGFGESPLRNFAIPELNDFAAGKGSGKDWFWDDVTNPGIRFDSSHPFASKIPLGRSKTKDKPFIMELIKPASKMAELILDDEKTYMKNGYHISEVLTHTRFVAGNQYVYDDFRVKRDEYLSNQFRGAGKLEETLKDFIKYYPEIEYSVENMEGKQMFDPEFRHGSKDIFHRLICCFVTSLGSLTQVHGESLFDFVDRLSDVGVFNSEAKQNLQYLIASTYAWRDATYTSIGGQEDYCFGNDGLITSATLLKQDAFQPDFEALCSILLGCRDALKQFCESNNKDAREVFANSNLRSENKEAIEDACFMFGFNTSDDIHSCESTAASFALFSCLYSTIFLEKMKLIMFKKGMEAQKIEASARQFTNFSGNSSSANASTATQPPTVIQIPNAPQSQTTLFQIPTGFMSTNQPTVEIPQDLGSRNQLTMINIPDTSDINQPLTIQIPQSDGSSNTIQIPPDVLRCMQSGMVNLSAPNCQPNAFQSITSPQNQLPFFQLPGNNQTAMKTDLISALFQNATGLANIGTFPDNIPQESVKQPINLKEELRRNMKKFFESKHQAVSSLRSNPIETHVAIKEAQDAINKVMKNFAMRSRDFNLDEKESKTIQDCKEDNIIPTLDAKESGSQQADIVKSTENVIEEINEPMGNHSPSSQELGRPLQDNKEALTCRRSESSTDSKSVQGDKEGNNKGSDVREASGEQVTGAKSITDVTKDLGEFVTCGNIPSEVPTGSRPGIFNAESLKSLPNVLQSLLNEKSQNQVKVIQMPQPGSSQPTITQMTPDLISAMFQNAPGFASTAMFSNNIAQENVKGPREKFISNMKNEVTKKLGEFFEKENKNSGFEPTSSKSDVAPGKDEDSSKVMEKSAMKCHGMSVPEHEPKTAPDNEEETILPSEVGHHDIQQAGNATFSNAMQEIIEPNEDFNSNTRKHIRSPQSTQGPSSCGWKCTDKESKTKQHHEANPFPSNGQEQGSQARRSAKDIIREKLAQFATDGTISGMLGTYLNEIGTSLLGQVATAAFGENSLSTLYSKTLIPNVSFASLVSVDERLRMLSELRRDHEVFEMKMREEGWQNLFVHPGENRSCMDEVFELGRMATENDGSHDKVRGCRRMFRMIYKKNLKSGFINEGLYRIQANVFSQIFQSSKIAMKKLDNMEDFDI